MAEAPEFGLRETRYDSLSNGTAATDVEQIVALAEALDSELTSSRYRTCAGDLDNLTIAVPAVNLTAEERPRCGRLRTDRNRGWFAASGER